MRCTFLGGANTVVPDFNGHGVNGMHEVTGKKVLQLAFSFSVQYLIHFQILYL